MENIEQKILKKLNEIEKENDISIIFAVDAGSRSYGCNTETSDYDIRFIYFYNDQKTYLKITKLKETIVGFSDDEILDWSGWEIRKAVQHLKESNPSIIEWLSSPIVYIDKNNFKKNAIRIANKMHSHLSLMYHYFNMAKNNWKTWIEDKQEVICKKYFYVIRPLASLIYIMDKLKTSPEDPLELIMNFDDLVKEISKTLNNLTKNELEKLIEKKRHLTEKEMSESNIIINSWIINVFDEFERLVKSDKSSESDVDFTVQSIIKTHKKLMNETKKIKDIINSCGYTARINYLTAIGFSLQLLWFELNPEKNSRELPSQINTLLKSIQNNKVNNEIRNEIMKVIIDLNEENDFLKEKNKKNTKLSNDDFMKYFIESGFRCIYKDNVDEENFNENLEIEKILEILGFDDTKIKLILNMNRNDSFEFSLKNFFELIWLICNTEENQSSRPKDIINNGDNTNTIPEKLLLVAKITISELRPKYVVGNNKILIEWFEKIILDFNEKVKMVENKLSTIKQENTKKRLNNSIKKLDPEEFDNLVIQTIYNI